MVSRSDRVPGSTPTAPPPVTRFVVEVARSRLSYQDVGALVDRARAAAARAIPPHGPVRFVRAVAVPEDGSCLLVFEAADPADVLAVARAALIVVDRVTSPITVGESTDEPAPLAPGTQELDGYRGCRGGVPTVGHIGVDQNEH